METGRTGQISCSRVSSEGRHYPCLAHNVSRVHACGCGARRMVGLLHACDPASQATMLSMLQSELEHLSRAAGGVRRPG